MKKLHDEYSLDTKELAKLEGPEEVRSFQVLHFQKFNFQRINMIEFHLIFLSNKYTEYKSELHRVDRIRKKRKLKLKEEENNKEMKLS